MKYISMKMDPKGSRPPMRAITVGLRYHCRSGMGEGIRFTLQGLSGSPFQLRPITCASTGSQHLTSPSHFGTQGMHRAITELALLSYESCTYLPVKQVIEDDDAERCHVSTYKWDSTLLRWQCITPKLVC